MNWTQTNGIPFTKADAIIAKKKYDKKNKGREVKLVKVCDRPLTFKEVFVD